MREKVGDNDKRVRNPCYRWSVESKCDDVLGDTLDFDTSQLAGQFKRTFEPET